MNYSIHSLGAAPRRRRREPAHGGPPALDGAHLRRLQRVAGGTPAPPPLPRRRGPHGHPRPYRTAVRQGPLAAIKKLLNPSIPKAKERDKLHRECFVR